MSGEVSTSALESARAAFERGEFAAACELYEAALAEERSAESLDRLGEALWLSGEIDAGIARREEAYAELRRSGEVARAAEIALWLVVEQATSLWNLTAAGGLFKRAERLLAGAPLCPAHPQLEVQRAQQAPDAVTAGRHFERALEIAKELGDPESEVRALSGLGFLRVSLGDVEGECRSSTSPWPRRWGASSRIRGRSARPAARCCSRASGYPTCVGRRSGAGS